MVNEYDPDNSDQWNPSKTIPLSTIRLALAIIDYKVVESERLHVNTKDLEAQVISRLKELAPVEWTWDKFKAKYKDPILKEGSKLWTNIVTAMRDAGIGEATKSKPLTFRGHTDVDGHRKMSALSPVRHFGSSLGQGLKIGSTNTDSSSSQRASRDVATLGT